MEGLPGGSSSCLLGLALDENYFKMCGKFWNIRSYNPVYGLR